MIIGIIVKVTIHNPSNAQNTGSFLTIYQTSVANSIPGVIYCFKLEGMYSSVPKAVVFFIS